MVTKTTTITSQLNAANVLAKPPVLKAAAGVSQGKANPAQGFEGPSPVLPGVKTPGSGFIPKTADDRPDAGGDRRTYCGTGGTGSERRAQLWDRTRYALNNTLNALTERVGF